MTTTQQRIPFQRHILKVAGKEFKSKLAACEYYDVDPSTFATRVQVLGWTTEEALGLAQRKRPYIRKKK